MNWKRLLFIDVSQADITICYLIHCCVTENISTVNQDQDACSKKAPHQIYQIKSYMFLFLFNFLSIIPFRFSMFELTSVLIQFPCLPVSEGGGVLI